MTTFSLTLTTPPGFRFRTTLLSHGWLQLHPFHWNEGDDTLGRVEAIGDNIIFLELRGAGTQSTDSGEPIRVESSHDLNDGERSEIESRLRRIFNLDIDLTAFHAHIADLPRYAWCAELGGGRLLRAPTVWEDLAKTLLTTNTTWVMTRAMVKRLTTLGSPLDDQRFAFPTPGQIADLDFEPFATHLRAGYRAASLHELATRIAEGELDVETWAHREGDALSSDDLYQAVTALRGFGPYAAGAVLKLLGRFDRLAIDSAARATFNREFNHGDAAPDKAIRAHYEPHGAWRGLMMWMDVMGPPG
ncbi:MAG: 3-methyladenine DNA glycosylase [Acidobacteriota bacterium]